MADELDSLVITLDEADSDSDVDIVFALDDELNTYESDGSASTTFYEDEDIHVLVQVPPGYTFAGATKTSGTVTDLGDVERTEEQLDVFFSEDEQEQSLTWYPMTALSISDVHLGNTPVLTVEDRKVASSVEPVIVDFDYIFRARSLRVRHPSEMNIDDDETFPLGIVIEVTK